MTNEEMELTIDYLKNIQEGYIEGEGYERHPVPEWYALDKAIELLEQTKWISASEKVPEDGQEVLLFDKNFGYVVGTYEMVDYFGVAEPSFLIHKSIDSLEKASIDPIAWMPLPQVYKAESEE